MKIVGLLVLLIIPLVAHAKYRHPEKFYQNRFCTLDVGQVEVRLMDKTRVDCLTQTHAIEFDFASKWAEAIGQSLYYSMQTGKLAGIALILEKQSDQRHLKRLNATIEHYKLPIEVFLIRP